MSYNRVAVGAELLRIAGLLQAGEKRIPVSSESVKEVGFTGKGYWWRASNGMKNIYDGAHAREKFIHSLGQELGNTGKALSLTKELEGKTASVVIAGDKIEVKSVVIDRVEGPNALCVKKTYTGKDAIEKASKALSLSRHTVDHSGYDKHDVVVTWEDGKVLKTRYDLERDYSSDTLESQLEHVLGKDAGVRLASIECKASKEFDPDTMKIGEILVCVWGTRETNVDFYKVKSVSGDKVTLRELEGKVVRGNSYLAPDLHKEVGAPITVAIRPNGDIFINSEKMLGRWDGTPQAFTPKGVGAFPW